MSDDAFELVPDAGPSPDRLLEARRRREIQARLVGEPRAGRSRARDDDDGRARPRCEPDAPSPAGDRASHSGTARVLPLADAMVIPAGATVRGYLRMRALVLAGTVVGNVHSISGPVVIRCGATLKGRLVAAGDVYVRGHVGDSGGGAVISTRGKLTLAPGARVEGDVRCGRLDLHEGAWLDGVVRACPD